MNRAIDKIQECRKKGQKLRDTLRDAEFTLCATFLMGQWLNYEVRMWWLCLNSYKHKKK